MGDGLLGHQEMSKYRTHIKIIADRVLTIVNMNLSLQSF